ALRPGRPGSAGPGPGPRRGGSSSGAGLRRRLRRRRKVGTERQVPGAVTNLDDLPLAIERESAGAEMGAPHVAVCFQGVVDSVDDLFLCLVLDTGQDLAAHLAPELPEPGEDIVLGRVHQGVDD